MIIFSLSGICCAFGRSQGYYMGMGRGSAVGSLVAYALEITGIDPVKNNLLF